MDIGHIKDLTPDPKNARKHNPRNIGMIVDSLHEVGAARSIVIDEDGRILCGNGTVDAAAEAGIEKVQVVDVDGETLVAVRRTGLTESQKTRLALLDNRSAETAEWDATVLAAMAEDGVKLDDLFCDDELTAILGEVPIEEGDGGDEFDTTPDDGPTTVQPGEVWALGKHRLMCGDSTKPEDVARLMDGAKADMVWTDPPYGVNFQGKGGKPIAGDITYTAIPLMFSLFPDVLAKKAWVYVCGGDNNIPLYSKMFERYLQTTPKCIIWDKCSSVMRHNGYHSAYEIVFTGYSAGAGAVWYHERGGDGTSDMWRVPSPSGEDREHLTQKPINLPFYAIRNSCPPDGIVYDPFAGSGGVYTAAHRLNRVCYGMEIEPKYCDVIIKRYNAETGEDAVRVYPDAT